MARFDFKKAVLKIKDGANHSITVKLGEGEFSYTERVSREYLLDRGVLDEIRDGDQVPVDVSLSASWIYVKGDGSTPSIEDALKKRGAASSWTSVDSDECNPYAVDIEMVYTPSCATGDKETITLEDFRYEEITHPAKSALLAITGKCNVTEATVVREAQ